MTTGRINQVAFVATRSDDRIPPAREGPEPYGSATRAVHEATAGSSCWEAFLNETTCLPTPSNLLERQSHKTGTVLRAGRVPLLGRENVLRCELTDGYSGVSRSSTRRARVLLFRNFRQCLFVQPILPFCVS